MRIEISMMIEYEDRYRTYIEVSQRFHEKYPDTPSISQETVSKIEAQFWAYGSKTTAKTPDIC